MSNPDSTTNGRRRELLARLEAAVRDAIDASYRTSLPADDPRRFLRDYVRDMDPRDKWEDLIAREMAHERAHRRFCAPEGFTHPLTVRQAATILVLGYVGDGARRDTPVPAEQFLQGRQSAHEAVVVGWLAREALRRHAGLIGSLDLLDYAEAAS